MGEAAEKLEINYSTHDAPTLGRFHDCLAPLRCIVGPVGSAKTSAAAWETIYYISWFLYNEFGITRTRGVIVRNTYSELIDTTQKTVFEWFSWGRYKESTKTYLLSFPEGPEIEILFRSCDRPEDVKKFKSLEITWAWLDESIEIAEEIKLMLKNRIGRYPSMAVWMKALRKHCPELRKLSDDEIKQVMEEKPDKYLTRFFIETTNPPDVEHPLYSQYAWNSPPPGPIPTGKPLKNHIGFWQKAGENAKNLRPGYYDDLRADYANNPDWIATYIEGKPGIILQGKAVYNNFVRDYHVAKESLVWSGGTLYRGWDHSGNTPACILLQLPTATQVQILKEFVTDKLGIVDFARIVNVTCNQLYPDAQYVDWGDPAGAAEFSKREGGFTSNSQLIREATQINIVASEQNFSARKESVEQQLRMRDGLLIDSSCTRLINGFIGGYCYPEIGKTGVYSDEPKKNRFAHVHEALQYVLVKLFRSEQAGAMTVEDARRMARRYGAPSSMSA